MKFMITKKSSGPVTKLLTDERVSNGIKETCAPNSNKETCANTSVPFTRTFLTNERKWTVIHAHSPDGGDLADGVFFNDGYDTGQFLFKIPFVICSQLVRLCCGPCVFCRDRCDCLPFFACVVWPHWFQERFSG